jgi:hypothetical protein
MVEQPESPAGAVKSEAARQAVILAFGVVSVLVMVWAQRAAGDPDFYRSQRMRAAKASERILARLAARAWRLAEAARREYDRESA